MVNLIPLAGKGSRFIDVGITIPKPLISVSGMPMIHRAINDLPPCDRWIFIVLEEHTKIYASDDVIRSYCHDAIIISTPDVTSGQASTCMLAASYIDDQEEVFIGAADIGMYCNFPDFINATISADCIVPSITQHECLKKNPDQYGWLILEDDNITIKDVSVKKAVSNNPYFDHSQTGFFYFKNFKIFKDSYSLMIKNNFRINGEFFIDSLPKFINMLGMKCVSFPIDLYPNWGTPKDLNDYLLIEHYCKYGGELHNKGFSEKKELWKKYFSR